MTGHGYQSKYTPETVHPYQVVHAIHKPSPLLRLSSLATKILVERWRSCQGVEEWWLSRKRERFERFGSARCITRLMPLFPSPDRARLRRCRAIKSARRGFVPSTLCRYVSCCSVSTLTDLPFCMHHLWCRRSSTRFRHLLPPPSRHAGRAASAMDDALSWRCWQGDRRQGSVRRPPAGIAVVLLECRF